MTALELARALLALPIDQLESPVYFGTSDGDYVVSGLLRASCEAVTLDHERVEVE